jgi:thiamine transport system permease protein
MNRLAGLLALSLLLGVVVLALAGLVMAGGADDPGYSWLHIRRLVVVSLTQASISTLLSLALGALLALALVRRASFPGRGVLIAAMNVATVLPAIVVVFAIVAVFGRAGWIGKISALAGLDLGSWLFGLPGILIAHVFFNAPLAARVYLASLGAISPEQWRLATHLGMPPAAIFRLIDRPVLWRETPGLASLIFLVCFTSFAIVLALGGGPSAATLEVAIFEALRFDAAFSRAAVLAALQIAICFTILIPVMALGRRTSDVAATGFGHERPDRTALVWRVADPAVIILGGAFITLPLMAIAANGLPAIASLIDALVLHALLTSLIIGIPAGLISTALAVALAGLSRQVRVADGRARTADLIDMSSLALLVVSPLALSAGLFVVLRTVINPFSAAPLMIMVINALIALPFAYRQVAPPLVLSGERYGRLADSLGITGLARARLVDWPLLKRPLIVALAITIALSLGDLGVAAFFGSGDLVTLPLLLYRKLGAYRMEEAAAVSLLLSLLVLALFLGAQRWSGDWFAHAR